MSSLTSYSLLSTCYRLPSTNYHVLFTNYHVNHLIRQWAAKHCAEKPAPNLLRIITAGVVMASAWSVLSIMYSTMPGRVLWPGPVPVKRPSLPPPRGKENGRGGLRIWYLQHSDLLRYSNRLWWPSSRCGGAKWAQFGTFPARSFRFQGPGE